MKKTILLLLFPIFIFSNCGEKTVKKSNETFDTSFYVANWNMENLFDTVDDPNKADEWFTPSSEINWNEEKLEHKLANLARVLKFMNNGKGPDILGVEEIEHEELLTNLIQKYIKKSNYSVAYAESPDKRGIDNGLIFNRDLFDLSLVEPLRINLADGKITRDILYVKLKSRITNEELHIFVNHWPSRRAGLHKTEKYRNTAAKTLLNKINKILSIENSANIIVLGDFNDLPSNNSISNILKAGEINCNNVDNNNNLFNVSYKMFQKGKGTYKYKDHWNMLDQMIISRSLLDKKNTDYKCNSFEIIQPSFMITKNGKYKGTARPTFGGRKYIGGYSDHFPIGAKFHTVK
jgi:predicted extracellular nuclease